MSAALQALTLDQVRLFVEVVRAGSFSAAARRLHRAQSAVSYGIANLERLLDVRLFDRTGRLPIPTPEARALLPDALALLEAVERFHDRAAGLAEGLESELRLAVDAICPGDLLVRLARLFQDRFPTVALQVESDVLDAVAARVREGACAIGIAGPPGEAGRDLHARFLCHIPMVPVAAPGHPLASLEPPLPRRAVRPHVQVVISRRDGGTGGPDHGVLADRTWRVADLGTKLDLLRAGLGWGNLPLDRVEADLAAGALVRLVLEPWGAGPLLVPLSALVRAPAALGPAGRWVFDRLPGLAAIPAPGPAPAR